jgi:hypothetical protein
MPIPLSSKYDKTGSAKTGAGSLPQCLKVQKGTRRLFLVPINAPSRNPRAQPSLQQFPTNRQSENSSRQRVARSALAV